MNVVFLNGKFLSRTEAFIPIDDRGFLFGHGVFTTIKIVNGSFENYHAHMARLTSHAKELKIESPIIDIALLQELLSRNHALEGVWRLKIILTGGASELRRMRSAPPGQILMTVEKQSIVPLAECRITHYPYTITGPTAKLKSLSYLNRLCMADYSTTSGFDDALVLSPEGWILEAAFANIFWRIKDKVYTPDASLPYLKGVSIGSVEKCIGILGLEWHPAKVKAPDLADDAQIYLTNSMIGIVPVVSYMEHVFPRDLSFEKRLINSFKSEIEHSSVKLFKMGKAH